MKNKIYDENKYHQLFFSIVILVYLIILQIVYPLSLSAMDLMDAYKRAKEHDPGFASSFYEHEATSTLPAQGLSLFLPQIQVSGNESRYYYDKAPSYYDDFRSESMDASLRQTIFNVPKFYEYRQNEIRGIIGDLNFGLAEQDLMLRVAEVYFNGLIAENLLDTIDAEKKAVMEWREQANRSYQAGVATITDVHNTEARYDAVLAKEIETKNNFDIKMQAIKRILGETPDKLIPLKEDISLAVLETESLEGWIDKAKTNHPLLKSSAFQINYQEAELRKNMGAFFPSIDLVAGYSRTNTNYNVKTDTLAYGNAGVQLNLPVFSGGYTIAKVKEARALLEKSRKEYENNLADVVQKLSEAFLGIRGNIAKIDALMTASRSASVSLKSNKMSLMAGVRTTIDVLNAERDLQEVRTNLLKARYECLMNIVRLKAYAGVLSEKDLQEINQWLQTSAKK